MTYMRHSILVLCGFLTLLYSAQVKSGNQDASLIALDCTIKGGASDGVHLLIEIRPDLQQVTISGMQGIDLPDITIIASGPPLSVPATPQFKRDLPEKPLPDPNHDPIYDNRYPVISGYLSMTSPLIEFGYTTWLPARPDDPLPARRSAIRGPESRFTIDRRTGAMRFHYAGFGLIANCAPQKKKELF